ncbi:MAG: FG-GAP repeat protein [Geodermatophilaceae bacterium]
MLTSLIGALGQRTVAGLYAGAAYVFVLSAAGWTERSSFRDPDGAADADLGTSVAVDGDSVVVGAPATNANRPDDKTLPTWSAAQPRLTATPSVAVMQCTSHYA